MSGGSRGFERRRGGRQGESCIVTCFSGGRSDSEAVVGRRAGERASQRARSLPYLSQPPPPPAAPPDPSSRSPTGSVCVVVWVVHRIELVARGGSARASDGERDPRQVPARPRLPAQARNSPSQACRSRARTQRRLVATRTPRRTRAASTWLCVFVGARVVCATPGGRARRLFLSRGPPSSGALSLGAVLHWRAPLLLENPGSDGFVWL